MTSKLTAPVTLRGAIKDASASPAKDTGTRLRCGDCYHFKGTAHPAMGKQCSQLGIEQGATAPLCYTANVTEFRKLGPNVIGAFSALVAALTPSQQRIMLGALRNAASLQRAKLQFLQVVYFRMGIGDALDQFYKGWAFARGPEGTIMVIGKAFLDGKASAMTALMDRASLLTETQFRAEARRLSDQGRVFSPPRRQVTPIDPDGYEPPTFETSPEQLERLANKKTKELGDRVKRAQSKTWEIDQSKSRKSKVDPDVDVSDDAEYEDPDADDGL